MGVCSGSGQSRMPTLGYRALQNGPRPCRKHRGESLHCRLKQRRMAPAPVKALRRVTPLQIETAKNGPSPCKNTEESHSSEFSNLNLAFNWRLHGEGVVGEGQQVQELVLNETTPVAVLEGHRLGREGLLLRCSCRGEKEHRYHRYPCLALALPACCLGVAFTWKGSMLRGAARLHRLSCALPASYSSRVRPGAGLKSPHTLESTPWRVSRHVVK